MTVLFVRALMSGSATTALRYEAELARCREDAKRREEKLQSELEWWRKEALRLRNGA